MTTDFREIRDRRIKTIKEDAERHGVPSDVALKMAEARTDKAMPNIVRTREGEGRSRPIEINTKR